MTEEGWLACADPQQQLAFLRRKVTKRKLRLFGCACGRRIWAELDDERSQHAIAVAESFADGLCQSKELMRARRDARQVCVELRGGLAQFAANCAELAANSDHLLFNAVTSVAFECAEVYTFGGDWFSHDGSKQKEQSRRHEERQGLSDLTREIFGNPFHRPKMARVLLTWRDATIPKLAQAAYDERELPSGQLDAKRLAILADALEEAGCTNEDVLAHLRGPGPHVRGCWVVDLLLGKK